jgi:hypothetical protein
VDHVHQRGHSAGQTQIAAQAQDQNPMGTMCGGNMYSAVHSIYTVMRMKNLDTGF